MNQSRAFSDKEITTIAAVAAAALGGIVVGLGRGQDNEEPLDARRAQIGDTADRARETGSEIVSRLQERAVDADLDSVIANLRDAYREAQSEGGSFLQRVSDKLGPKLSLDQLSAHLPVDSDSLEEWKSKSREAVKSNVPDLREARKITKKVDTAAVRERVKQQLERQRAPEPEAGRDGIVPDLISERLSSLEEGISSAPDKARDAQDRAGRLMRRKVADPVSSAATTTKDATLDSVAALAWLSLGAAVVYFGLLSAERREQVKAVLCGAIEQGRLLMLDFQGYEPEE